MSVESTAAGQAESFASAAFEEAIAATRVVAPAAGGILARVGLGATSFAMPEVAWLPAAVALVRSPLTHYALLGALCLASLGWAYHEGWDAEASRAQAAAASLAQAEANLVAAKSADDAAAAKAAGDDLAKTATKDEAEIAALQAVAASVPATRSCPHGLMDVIQRMGR